LTRYGIKSNRLRPPYGAYNSRVSNIAYNLGYRICTWTIDSCCIVDRLAGTITDLCIPKKK